MCQTSNLAYNPLMTGVIGSVIASFLTIGILQACKFLKKTCWKYKLKAIFGKQENDPISLILPVFRVRQDIISCLQVNHIVNAEFPLIKSDGSFVRSEKLIANCDTKALKYLSDLLSNKMYIKPNLLIDEDLSKKLALYNFEWVT